MIRFITKILLVSVFFIGLGAIADGLLNSISSTKNDLVIEQRSVCPKSQIKVVKLEGSDQSQYKFRMMLPTIDELPDHEVTIEKPIVQKKIVIFSHDQSLQ